jgi:hypothetical protein
MTGMGKDSTAAGDDLGTLAKDAAAPTTRQRQQLAAVSFLARYSGPVAARR